jgi:hypothetical protein
VLADSWYSSQHLLDLFHRRDSKYIGAVKSNRKFRTSGQNHQVHQWVKLIPKNAFDRVKVKGNTYKVWSAVGHLASEHRVKLVTNRRHRHQKWHYLISTDLTLSLQTILSYYLVRWEVENLYRAAKQLLGWDDYQMRRLVVIERHVLLMMVTHAYLELQRQELSEQVADGSVHVTLGDLQRQQQTVARRATIALVFTLTQRGHDLETICERLRRVKVQNFSDFRYNREVVKSHTSRPGRKWLTRDDRMRRIKNRDQERRAGMDLTVAEWEQSEVYLSGLDVLMGDERTRRTFCGVIEGKIWD